MTDQVIDPPTCFTIVHISTSHKRMATGVTVVAAPTLEAALQKLQVDSANHNETTEALCAFAGHQTNLLVPSMREGSRPSSQIITAKELPRDASST